MAFRAATLLTVAVVVTLAAPAAFSFWAPPAATQSPQQALRGASPVQANSMDAEAPVAFPNLAVIAAACALGLCISFSGSPVSAYDEVPARKADKVVVTPVSKAERVAAQKAKMLDEARKTNLLKPDGTLKPGQ